MHDLMTELERISDELTGARRAAKALAGAPEGLPSTLEDAYRIQNLSIAKWNDEVAGWKVGGVPPAYADQFTAKRLAGPIFAKSVQQSSANAPAAMPIFEGGFAAIEPEFIVQLGDTREQDRLFAGAEIASSPIPDINGYGPIAVISDFGNNHGMLIGPEVADWQAYSSPLEVVAVVNSQEVGRTTLADIREHVAGAVDFLIAHFEQAGQPLPTGTYVSTGAITGIHEAEIGATSTLDFGPFGTVALELVKAEARTA